MKTAVYKYPFEIAAEFSLEMPAPGDIVHVDMQNGVPCIWAVVWPDSGAVVTRKFRIHGTGKPWEDTVNMKHHGTLIEHPGPRPMVWHVFEVEPWNADMNAVAAKDEKKS